ncbi:hypothetical protein ISF_08425 [Cordyceps fumosorosea ARSEF 2679]|uniref:Chromo domain-like protein n=1 Tax=Cordyceps fumosorosea (strain ARSEF 2679) TaxID=1081104 RepID=A0A167MCG2_CORFA|nr:hypothetical protein ISF_08425 [Cordyceps fumosorosea ARSEF 2679]OAA54198.1 hypothetical protein ISF_08425 [Cordyceps fumosorosea ARSEF 2679]
MPTSKKPARTGKKPAKQPKQTGWFTIRRILDEKRVANRVQYLVDWDDDVNTGESYEPTWAWSADVTALAKDDWQRIKASTTAAPPPPTSESLASQNSPSDQSPRPANFRQLERAKTKARARSSSTTSADSIDAGPAPKRLRYSPSPSAEPVPSIVSAHSSSPDADVPEIESPTDAVADFFVGIPKAADFDPTDFLSVRGSQSASYPSQSLSELEEQDQRLALSSQISSRTIPDSQDFSGQTLSTASQLVDSLVSSKTESSCVVIPDSLERAEDHIIPAVDAGNTQEHIPESSIPAEANANSAIPSHQQRAKEPSFTDVPAFDTSPDRSAQPSKSSQAAAGGLIAASTLELPEFLTQVEILEPPTFLSTSTPQEQPSLPPSPAPESPALESPDPQHGHRPSQDAQVVFPLHDVSMEDNTDSNPGTQRSAVDELKDIFTIKPMSYSGAEPQDASNQATSTENDVSGLSEAPREMQPNSPPPVGSIDSSHWHLPTEAGAVNESGPTGTASGIAFNTQPDTHAQLLVPIHTHEELPGTISPSDVLQSAGAVLDADAGLTLGALGVSPSAIFGSSAEPIPAAQKPPSSPSSSATSDDPILMQHIITLPFQASLRPEYDATLLAHKKLVENFSEVFSNEEYVEPEPSLVAKIDDLFLALRNLCDYPQDIIGTTLENLSPQEQVKYACDANPKFCFVFELLNGIETNHRVLIIVQSVELMRLLAYVTTALKIDCSARALESLKNSSNESACSVTLALPDEEFDIDEFEVVIGFDHSFGGSLVARALSPAGQATRPPLVLSLVTTHSIEHLDRQLPEDLSPLERRHALLVSIVNARKLTNDPDRGYPEPYQIASIFYDYLNGAIEGVLWEPIPIPEGVLDIYMNSQSQSQSQSLPAAETEVSRKRKLDDDNEEEAKRVRMIPKAVTTSKEEVPLPDDVRWLLDSAAEASNTLPGAGVSIQVSLAVLQAIAEKASGLERQVSASDMTAQYRGIIENQEARIKDYERTEAKTYRAYRAALEERTAFEREKKKADTALQSAQEAAQKESTKLQAKIGELEATVSRLTTSSDGEEASPLATSERLLKEAQEHIKKLEKRLKNATQDGEYAKNAYQEASNSATTLQVENRELKEQNEKLRRLGSDVVTRVHEIHSESMAKTYLKQIGEMKVQMREREMELDRVREELRQARTRRETRQASVPRSPRMGLMSPRTGRPYTNPASRGTSPTATTEGAMIGALPAGNGNGRWNHLRE